MQAELQVSRTPDLHQYMQKERSSVISMDTPGCAPFMWKAPTQWGNVCPARARRAIFVLSILALAPSLSSPREVPQVDRTGPQIFPAKASCTSRNMRIQQHKMSLRM